MLDAASGVAPEFGADVLIRIAESGKVVDRTLRLNLLERAFYFASAVDTPVQPATSVFVTDTRSGYLALSFSMLKLDKLSLQSRVVADILPISAKKARVLFDEIKLPILTPVSCAEPLTYDVSAFYKTASQIAQDGFSATEKQKELRLALLQPYVGVLQSHVQVRPAAQLLLNPDLSMSTPSVCDRITFAWRNQ
jgi:hypothetical protein